MNRPERYLGLCLICSVIGYFLGRQLSALHGVLLEIIPALNSYAILFVALTPLTTLLVIAENKYFWGRFLSLRNNAEIWGLAAGLHLGFVTLSIY
ncbi:hypothetical protein [Pseudoalteromonas rubra]|uniref:CPBP family intramembrane metalloprotease n=1 Tax=Pseudoalteromonas rubra TaxID=43658 RepID=A0A0F4QE61_9GAMM|nr:hypothetical protein [Pseudoalteromonas rubra]KJZ05590.1 hypothetical protein TW77_21945 [Pseudoalteromonas rubra]